MSTLVQEHVLPVNLVSASARDDVPPAAPAVLGWTALHRVLFRIGFLFVLQLTFPFKFTWSNHVGQRPLRYLLEMPRFFGTVDTSYVTIPGESGTWGLWSFATTGLALVLATAGGLVWSWLARTSTRTEYEALNYWIRLWARFYLSVNMLFYGYMKLFPIQMPFPSVANLHTLFGEHASYRLYWQHVGLVTWFEVFLGAAEVTAGLLILFRATTAVGAFLNVSLLVVVAHANLAYDGTVHVRSATFALVSAFLLAQYLPDVWRLLIKREDTRPVTYRPVFTRPWQRYAWTAFRVAALVVIIPGYAHDYFTAVYRTNFGKEPRTAGLAGVEGQYHVTEFRLNGAVLPYSPTESKRWHEVAFERYRTVSYKVNRALPIALENGGNTFWDFDKRYELAGFAGGRIYLHYDIEDGGLKLRLKDKSGLVKPKASLTWDLRRPSESRIIVSGRDLDGDEIYAVLDRQDEKHPINIESPVEGETPRYARTFEPRFPLTDPATTDGKGAPRNMSSYRR